MFVIYTPEIKAFLHSIIPVKPIPGLEWDCKIHDIGIIHTKEDAIMMAKEVQRIRAEDNIFHYTVQILRIGQDRRPDMNIPVYEISSPKRVSLN